MENVYLTSLRWCQSRGIAYRHLAQTASTNDWAKSAASEISEATIFLAEHQSAGRGRGDNTWSSPTPGHGLLISFVYPLGSPPQPVSSPLFGLHLFRSLRSTWPGLDWSMKAPNDIYLGSKKIAGLLLETVQTGERIHLIAGLGINVLSHPDTEEAAIHLNSEEGLGQSLDETKWDEFLDHLQSSFSLAAQSSIKAQLSDAVREDLVEALNKNPRRSGLIVEVSSSGDLVFEDKTVSWQDL